MSAETIMEYCRLEFRVASHCAPVLKGIKISNMVSVPKGVCDRVKQALEGSNVCCAVLYKGSDRDILLLYRYRMLTRYLNCLKVRSFLSSMGYRCYDPASVIIRLKARYLVYAQTGADFPHELGVVLQYPVQDVEDFIRYKGQNFLLSGYWKVYHNIEYAREVFRRYDEAREIVAAEMINGRSLCDVAVSAAAETVRA